MMTLTRLLQDIQEGMTTESHAKSLAMALGYLWDYSNHADFREIMRQAGFEIDDESKSIMARHLIDL